ncbi:MAG: hypothetical protein ABW352_13255 [Polyangiales bacterium]
MLKRLRAHALLLLLVVACSEDPALPGGQRPPSGNEDGDDDDGDGDGRGERGDAGLDARTPPPERIDASLTLDANTPPTETEEDATVDATVTFDASLDAYVPPEVDAGNPFASCVAELEPRCKPDDTAKACSSVITPTVALSDGGSWGGSELKAGPYGWIVDFNQGKSFATRISSAESSCAVLAASFGESEESTASILDLRGADLSLYTVFRPACMREGETYPVITWGNGTCGRTGGYASLLATVASHGFVVVASNSRFTDGGNKEMLRALDFAAFANGDKQSPLYQRLALDKIGAMGHSQGAAATAHAAPDARIKAMILWNGTSDGEPAKPYLQVTGDRDIGNPTVARVSSAVRERQQAGAWLFYRQVLVTGGNVTGHLLLMQQPERVTDVTVDWWKYILLGDKDARAKFVGANCELCSERNAYEYGQSRLP